MTIHAIHAIHDAPTHRDLLDRCRLEGVHLQEHATALSAIAGALRADVQAKADGGNDEGLSLAHLDGLALALQLLSERVHIGGDTLETLAGRQGAAA